MATPELPSPERLVETIDAFAEQPIMMVADLVVDRFISGSPKRISREAPVLILRRESETCLPGGGANAVFNVRSLGGNPRPVGVVGNDENGDRLLELFESHGIRRDGILRRAGWETPCKTRILGGARHAVKQQIVRYDVGEPRQLGDSERTELADRIAEGGQGCRWAVFSDYGLGAVEPRALETAREVGLTCLVDSRYQLRSFTDVEGATPNQEELESIAGSLQPPEVPAAGNRLRQSLGNRFLLVTRGSDGMSLIDSEGAHDIPCYGTAQVADVTGAGDTVIGAFALALSAGASPLEAALLANYAGGIVVMKAGTATVSADELRAAVRRDPTSVEGTTWAGW